MTDLRMALLRHSFSEGNARHEFSGTADVPLAPEGVQMVRDYRAQGVYERACRAERYYSSPLRRCLQTFELAFGPQAQLTDVIDEFHEIEFGEMEGRVLGPDEVHDFFARWVAGEPEPGAPHLETFAQLQARGTGAVRALALRCASEGVGSVTVVTHSAISRAILGGLARLTPEQWLFLRMPNALGYTMELRVNESAAPDDPGAVRLVRATPYGPGTEELPVIEPAQ